MANPHIRAFQWPDRLAGRRVREGAIIAEFKRHVRRVERVLERMTGRHLSRIEIPGWLYDLISERAIIEPLQWKKRTPIEQGPSVKLIP